MDPRNRTLHALVRLRRTEADRARATLARMLADEQAAADLVQASRARIESERQAAMGDATFATAFGDWLPVGREAVERAQTGLDAARRASEQARVAMMQANAALKAAQAIVDKRQEEENEIRTRREQNEIDDLSRRTSINLT
ncbi:MAG: flagellar FliJ family protein [Acetobacter sp.]|uniref:flagellar FliJ family protein n=1 Tax=Acetobacter sp. TaxID=440 RepID=UPI0039E953B9